MIVITPGSEYLLENLKGDGTQRIQFTKKAEGGGYIDGTSNEEVVAMLIDRLLFFQAQSPRPSQDTETIIMLLRSARRLMDVQLQRKLNRKQHDATTKDQ